jgi:CheY-like chemotaxis protein
MLIDDNEIDNIINEKILESNNFADTIMVFQKSEEALAYLKEHQRQPELLPEIIFLDINMPVMDGFQFLKEFDSYGDVVKKTCNIIMLSSSISPRDVERASDDDNIKLYLNKPLSSKYLKNISI